MRSIELFATEVAPAVGGMEAPGVAGARR
jgi:hypothetical protein